MAENLEGAFTTQYSVQREEIFDSGRRMMPVSGPTGTEAAQVVQLFNPTKLLAIHWIATKIGSPPLVPSPSLLDSKSVFLYGQRGALVPPQNAEATARIWTLFGTYFFATNSDGGLTGDMPTGRLPFDSGTANQNTVPASNFKNDILGGDGGTPPLNLQDPLG